jgi:hypothetical protein
MKIKHERVLKDGRIQVLIELASTEAFPVAPLDDDAFYQLNYPHDDIVQGFHINNPKRVYWDTLEQKWREA